MADRRMFEYAKIEQALLSEMSRLSLAQLRAVKEEHRALEKKRKQDIEMQKTIRDTERIRAMGEWIICEMEQEKARMQKEKKQLEIERLKEENRQLEFKNRSMKEIQPR